MAGRHYIGQVTAPELAAGRVARVRAIVRPSHILALALPLVFLHRRYQPNVAIAVGGTSANVFLSDLAVGAVVVTALVEARLRGLVRLRGALPLWLAASSLLAWILVRSQGVEHLVTALKYGEYALLAPAAVLLLRTREDILVVLRAATAWGLVATAAAALQFVGALPAWEAYGVGTREPSLLGIHDFGVFSGAVLSLGLAAILLGARERQTEIAAGVAGALGVVLAAAMDAVVGLGLAAVALWLLVRASARRTIALAAVVAVVAGGAIVLRGPTVEAFLEFIGLKPKTEAVTANVQSWSQRVTLGYIGLRVFLDHPLLGAGWQKTTEYRTLAPYVADAERRFPDQPKQAFPSPAHPWGVQDSPVQLLADLGVVGFLLAVATLIAGVRLAIRAPPTREALVALGWLAFAVGVSLGSGLVAGIPLDAVLWLGLGLAAAAAANCAPTAR
jgi:hypothetical protein